MSAGCCAAPQQVSPLSQLQSPPTSALHVSNRRGPGFGPRPRTLRAPARGYLRSADHSGDGIFGFLSFSVKPIVPESRVHTRRPHPYCVADGSKASPLYISQTMQWPSSAATGSGTDANTTDDANTAADMDESSPRKAVSFDNREAHLEHEPDQKLLLRKPTPFNHDLTAAIRKSGLGPADAHSLASSPQATDEGDTRANPTATDVRHEGVTAPETRKPTPHAGMGDANPSNEARDAALASNVGATADANPRQD